MHSLPLPQAQGQQEERRRIQLLIVTAKETSDRMAIKAESILRSIDSRQILHERALCFVAVQERPTPEKCAIALESTAGALRSIAKRVDLSNASLKRYVQHSIIGRERRSRYGID